MKLAPEVQQTLNETFGITDLRLGQESVIAAILAGKDVFARMSTGHGKSLCYQLPAALEENRTTIVISPLIALMRDQLRALLRKGISATDLTSAHSRQERANIFEQIRSGIFRLLYVAPEQLEVPDFFGEIQGIEFSRIIVDEAHCISTWGHDFRHSYLKIAPFAISKGIRQKVALTATASRSIVTDVKSALGMEDPFEYYGDLMRPNLKYRVQHCKNDREKAQVLLNLVQEYLESKGSIVIYCATRPQVMSVFDFLHRKGLPVVYYHAGMPKEDRKEAERLFFTNRRRVIIATNAFGMGIDKSDIRLLLHFNMPSSIESYLQETGRAGRDGNEAYCVLLATRRDPVIHRILIHYHNPKLLCIARVYNALVAQKRIHGSTDGSFPLGMNQLRNRTISPRVSARTDSTGHLDASLAVLQEFGILQLQRGQAFLNGFRDENEIEAYTTKKEATAIEKLKKMQEYVDAEDPSQELLISLLEQN